MGRWRHALLPDHELPGLKAEIGHGKIMGADRFTLPAQRTGIDKPVGLVDTFDDGRIIIHPPGVGLGIGPELRQIDTVADAFQALTVNTAPGLQDCLLATVAGGINRLNPFPNGDIPCLGEQGRFPVSQPHAVGGKRGTLQKTIHGYGSLPTLGDIGDKPQGMTNGTQAPGEASGLRQGKGLEIRAVKHGQEIGGQGIILTCIKGTIGVGGIEGGI